jgi:hypothetical protein
MGLLYVFPVGEDETEFVIRENDTLILKSYGLPYIFWIYAACIIAVIFFMLLAIKEPVLKLVQLGDETDALLGYSLLSFIAILPLSVLSFFFYEKRITRKGKELGLVHRLFGITVLSETFSLQEGDELTVAPFLSSPNMARIQGAPDSVGFQNKGYFVLWLKSKEGRNIQIDRHSRKVDLEKLKALLENS